MSEYEAPVFLRREILQIGAGLIAVLVAPSARASQDEMKTAMAEFTRGAVPREGRVTIDIPALVENGNSVPLTLTVESAMKDADFVKTVAIFNERNPQPNIAHFNFTPRSGRAFVSTRIRLGDSQKITAIAEMADGTFWQGSADLIVTLPACVEN